MAGLAVGEQATREPAAPAQPNPRREIVGAEVLPSRRMKPLPRGDRPPVLEIKQKLVRRLYRRRILRPFSWIG
ncbi:MAG TPA: hypothetical protein VN231_09405 [Allosphingosinicella sp.]|nr:hypothetical protein [Allosphingosinicella sp.]